MDRILDIILAAFIVLIIIYYSKRGCKTIFSLITPLVTFVCSYLFGKPIGKIVLGNGMLNHTTDTVHKLLNNLVQDIAPDGNITFGVLREHDLFRNILNTTVGHNSEGVLALFDDKTVITDTHIAQLSEEIAVPVAGMLSQIVGCIIVFIVVRIIMFVVSKVFAATAKLPILKQFDGVLGVIIGIISAFVYTWVISLILSFIIRYGLIGSESDMLYTMAKNSYIMNFFCNLSLVDIVNLVK